MRRRRRDRHGRPAEGEDRIALGEAAELPGSGHECRRERSAELVGVAAHRDDRPLRRAASRHHLDRQPDRRARREPAASRCSRRGDRDTARPNASIRRRAVPRTGQRVPGPAGWVRTRVARVGLE